MRNYLKIGLLIGLFLPCLLQAQTKSFEVGTFDGIKCTGSANIVLIQGDTHSVEAEGSDEQLEKLDIYVKDDILRIGQKRGNNGWGNWKSNGNLKIYITFHNIQELTMSGSGNINCEDEINFDDLEVRLSGSGNIKLAGEVDDFDVSISGSGNIDAFPLEAETVDASISGSGNIEVSVSKELEARVSGSGRIVYDPEGSVNIDTRTTGSGSIRKR